MLGPKSDNSIENGHGNTQVGQNSGTLNIGLTYEQHEAALKQALADRQGLLERAHAAEQTFLQNEIQGLKARLENVEQDYVDRIKELEHVKSLLARYDNQLSASKRDAANAALEQGDTTLAQALLKELARAARNRREDAAREEAVLEFELGELAEAEIRWADAAKHYAKAARLAPAFETLRKASEYVRRSGDYASARRFSADLVDWATESGMQEHQASALNEHAENTRQLGRYSEAEHLYRQAQEIARAAMGETDPNYAVILSNLALVVQAQGRYSEAEDLCLQAQEIARATIGETDRLYAIHLNNLAGVVRAQGRYSEAEDLYRQALKIDRATIGETRSDYAIHLNNLAGAVQDQERFEEAEDLYLQALKIDRATIGETHSDYAIHLNNLAGAVQEQSRLSEAEDLYRQALEIDRATIGEAHQDYAIHLTNLGDLLGEMGRLVEAREMLTKALAIFRDSLPPEHPIIAGTKHMLDALPDT